IRRARRARRDRAWRVRKNHVGLLTSLLRSPRRAGVRRLCVLVLFVLAGVAPRSEQVPIEYQVKAGYLFNFLKFIEWPDRTESGPLTICIAGHNPFGGVLAETLRAERVNNRSLATRVIPEPQAGCAVIFVPKDTATTAYLRAVRGAPTLTVGERPGFIGEGGIINFVLEQGKVRFEIDPKAAERADLRISSHLLRLARISYR